MALLEEITSGPLAAELAPFVEAGDDVTVAAILNDTMRGELQRGVKIPVQDAYLYLLKRLRWRGIEEAANNPAHPAREAAYVAVKLVSAPGMLVDFTDPVSSSLLGGLMATGLVSEQNKAELEALCTRPISRAEAALGRPVGIAEIAALRGL